MDFIAVNIEFDQTEPWREIAIARLSTYPFEGFAETKSGFVGYIPMEQMTPEINQLINGIQMARSVSQEKIPATNWNAKWEAAYDPVLVSDELVIAAPFHIQSFSQKWVLRIQPQMSFGTGHHQTTRLMARSLIRMNPVGMNVADVGTGTGVLAILAAKLGASEVLGIDNDPGAIENAQSNGALNQCTNIRFLCGDESLLNPAEFDVLLANINKNTLVRQLSVYSKSIKPGGKLLLSGFFSTDSDGLVNAASACNFKFDSSSNENEWCLLQFSRT